MEHFTSLQDIDTKEIFPGYLGKFIHTREMTIAFWKVKAGSEVPFHQHPHEQVATVQHGKFELTVDNETQILEPGMVAVIPSNTKHAGRAITDCELIDIFCPVREDYRDRK